MTYDNVWMYARYILLSLGGFLVGRGTITEDQLTYIVGAIGAISSVLWGVYVKWGTKSVSVETAMRADVPTVSGLTGAKVP